METTNTLKLVGNYLNGGNEVEFEIAQISAIYADENVAVVGMLPVRLDSIRSIEEVAN